MAQHAQPVLGPAGCRDLPHAQRLLRLRRLARSEGRVVSRFSSPKRQSERRVARCRCITGRAHLLGRAWCAQLCDEAQEEVERAVVAAVEADEQLERSVCIEPLREQVEHCDGQPRHRIVHRQDHAELDRGRSCRGGRAECGQRRGGGGRVADARVVAHRCQESASLRRGTRVGLTSLPHPAAFSAPSRPTPVNTVKKRAERPQARLLARCQNLTSGPTPPP